MAKAIRGVEEGTQGTHFLSDGTTVQMPLLSMRSNAFGAYFLIDAAKAQALIPGDLRPVLVTPDHALINIQVLDYLEKNIDPYREFYCSIPVHRSPEDNAPVASLEEADELPGNGSYIVHIAVDVPQALWIGRDVLGLPKIFVNVELSETDTERTGTVSQHGEKIFSLSVNRPDGAPEEVYREFHGYTVSPLDNALYHIPYQLDATATVTQGAGHAKLELGTHPIAGELRELGIVEDAIGAVFVPQYSLISNMPDKVVPLPDWKDPRYAYREEFSARVIGLLRG